ncbi:MAG: histidine phosphatase family protein [Bacteroidia bacterium]
MKTLVLIRHSKSSYFTDEHNDIDRPLNERGYKDAEMMCDVLKKEKLKIGKIISSPAVRAISTALIFAHGLKVNYENVAINKLLYQCGKEKILEVIKAQEDELNQMMIVGHNPDFEELLRYLVKEKIEKYPTTGIALVTFNVTKWNDINHQKGKLIKLLLPEQFRDDPANQNKK